MARPIKEGLDYFELDCHMDEKVRMIQAEFGLKGFAVVVLLFMEIYGGHGYYMRWDEDGLLLFALKIGSAGGDKNLIADIVNACIKRGIFSNELYEKYGILTSSGIQKRYINATSRREEVNLKKEYLLIDVVRKKVSANRNSENVDRNSENVDENTQRRVEKRKEENTYSVGNIDTTQEEQKTTPTQQNIFPQAPIPELDIGFLQKIMDTWNAIPHVVKLSGITPMTPRYDNLRMCIGIVGVDGVFAAIQKIADSEYFKQRGSVQFDKYIDPGMIQKVMEGTYDKNFRTAKNDPTKTKFTNFNQRNYDYSELERKLMNKGW